MLGNQAVAGPGQISNGGGIDNQEAVMTIRDSTIRGNQSLGGAGANGVGPAKGEALGGGIMNVFDGTLTIVDSSITGNQAVGGANSNPSDKVLAEDPLVGGALGGGIENLALSTLTVIGSTVSGNLAQSGSSTVAAGAAAQGGGIGNGSG